MILDHDCVRELLLSVENNIGLNDMVPIDKLESISPLDSYDQDIVRYAALKMIEAGYIHAKPLYADNMLIDIRVGNLTTAGHEFLDNVRDSTIWQKTKERSSKVAGASLPVLANIAGQLIKEQLGLN
ncbi:DUF2513 domain-containing protein [uncultured Marinococcus sp.]|uniref:DUF2513 domain-containing protein n=1 Tax=uncultured Marinococcus sp. TaxID=487012 RepID=UPI002636BD42|nr:DUF2513 domain-containing protein [uncultured Marinococcus sp.]